MIENYKTFLSFLDEKFTRFFEQQKPYIFCQKGCGKCCKKSQFPYTQIEAVYLLQGAQNLDDETLKLVLDNVKRIKQELSNFNGERFRYDCPFLINNECSVYEYRGILCRSFGLMTIDEDKSIRVPFCCFEGLNYSNVMQDDGKNVSPEKFQKLGIEEEPLAFNVDYKSLLDPEFERGFNFKFGERKPLIEWL